ncbi:MAG TPA: nucleotide exchange factor GrpE [Longimicrobiaceae bacterium]|nr:nucleotide exchange factor GrpE [Longimicrobiaceae bacterium]
MAENRHRHARDAHPQAPEGEEPRAAVDAGAVEEVGPDPGANGLAGGEAPAGPDPAAEVGALRDRHLRLAAEFENYRKRVERERSEAWVRAQAELAGRLLEPLDDLQRIADFDPATTPSGALHEGAEMVERKFLRALEAAGLEAVDDAAGKPFDPTVHEALTTVPAASAEEDDTVAEVYQKGYRFKGVLLRPARVLVKKYLG